jgi:atlastin
LNKIFVYNEKAIILMDTQGIFDQELNQAMTVALISLSTIVSSYQIYNLDKRIQEDHLCNMAYFSAYSSLLSNKNNTKIGQTLCLLVRDWQNYENNFDLDKCDMEANKYRDDFLYDDTNTDKVRLNTRKKIFNTYDEIVVKLCPHPGYLVTEGKFSGKLSEIRDDFKIHVEHIISNILMSVKAKRISETQTLLCSELPEYMKEYVMLYENVKSSLPHAMTILETTEKICHENAKTKTIQYYKDNMMLKIKSKSMTNDDINAWHDNCLRESRKYFNKLYIMGKEEDIVKTKTSIIKDIEKEKENFLMMSCGNATIFTTLFRTTYDYLDKFNVRNFVSAEFLNNLLIKIIMSVLIFVYILSFFIPFGDAIASIVKYLICLFCGIYLSSLQNEVSCKKVIGTMLNEDKSIYGENVNNNLGDNKRQNSN